MKIVLRLLLLMVLLSPGVHLLAQQATPDIQQRINSITTKLEELSRTVREDEHDDAALLRLRGQLDPLSSANQDILNELQPQLDAARQQLEQVGPKPAAGETPDAAKARADLQKTVDDLDAPVRRARVIAVRIAQVSGEITNARRDLLLGEIFKVGSSALNPALWYEAIRAQPRVWQSSTFVVSDWANRIQQRLTGARLLRFLAAIIVLAAAYILLRKLSRRVLSRRSREGEFDMLDRTLTAIWTALVIAILPIAAALAFVQLLRAFDLVTPFVEPLLTPFVEAVRIVSVSVGLARGVLAPGHSQWRLLSMQDAVARKLNTLAVNFSIVVAALNLVEAFNGVITAPLEVSVAWRALLTSVAAGLLAYSLFGAARIGKQLDAELGPRVDNKRDWYAIWRVLVWMAIATVFLANAFGYVNFANFMINQIMWVTFLLVAGFILRTLAHEIIAKMMRPESAFANAASTAIGVPSSALRQVSILLSGIATLLIYFAGILLILAPWGVESYSVLDTLQAAFYGFSFGAINFSLAGVVIAFILFLAGFLATRAFQRWLEANYLPSTALDAGLQNSITTSAGYVGVIAAIILPFAYLGFNFEKLAIVAGALSLGIGFGLQSIVSNFVSGLILLWERAIKVGDWVVVGPDQGIVKRINVRSTEIETFERQTVIVPNSNLISGVVKNWVRTDRSGRISVEVGVDYHSDPNQVRDILLACAKDHPEIAELPEPIVLFTAFGDSALNFELRCFVHDVDKLGATRSDLRFEIFKRFQAADISIPYPQSDINLRNLDQLVELIAQRLGGGTGISPSAASGPTSVPGIPPSSGR